MRRRIVHESLNLAAAQKLLINAALDESQTQEQAAKKLGITRHTLRRLMLKHRIEFVSVHPAHVNKGAE